MPGKHYVLAIMFNVGIMPGNHYAFRGLLFTFFVVEINFVWFDLGGERGVAYMGRHDAERHNHHLIVMSIRRDKLCKLFS